jgi:arylsulfatase A-like enzyme
MLYTGRESGLSRGFIHYEDYHLTLRQLRLSSGIGQFLTQLRSWDSARRYWDRKLAETVIDEFLGWLDATSRRPFFAFLNYMDAHEPYRDVAKFRGKFKGPTKIASRYEAGIAALDEQLDVLFSALEGRGLMENTIVVITADHGELVGEHGLDSHGKALYRELLEVPLLMWGPGIPGNLRVRPPVTLRDLPATIADVAVAGGARFPGHSLAAYWRDGISTSPIISRVTRPRNLVGDPPVRAGTMASLVDGSLQYIRLGDGTEELYNLELDPRQETNLSRDASYAHILTRLRSEVEQIGHSR